MIEPAPPAKPTRKLLSSGLVAVFFLLVLIYGLAKWIVNDPTAREVLGGGLANVFGLLSTPFILEGTAAFVGLVAVMTYNQWRVTQDDGWVIMEVKDETEVPTSTSKQEES